MPNETKFKHECNEETAPKFLKWISERGGVAVWKSINLSNPGASWSSPATIRKGDCDGIPSDAPDADEIIPYPKPTWQASNTPIIFTNLDEIGVYTDALYKAFRVGLKMSGMSSHLTDGAQRKLDKVMTECEEKHGSAHYKKGVLDIDGASIGVFYDTEIISLREWSEKQSVNKKGKYNE